MWRTSGRVGCNGNAVASSYLVPGCCALNSAPRVQPVTLLAATSTSAKSAHSVTSLLWTTRTASGHSRAAPLASHSFTAAPTLSATEATMPPQPPYPQEMTSAFPDSSAASPIPARAGIAVTTTHVEPQSRMVAASAPLLTECVAVSPESFTDIVRDQLSPPAWQGRAHHASHPCKDSRGGSDGSVKKHAEIAVLHCGDQVAQNECNVSEEKAEGAEFAALSGRGEHAEGQCSTHNSKRHTELQQHYYIRQASDIVALHRAAQLLRGGRLVAMPTETVYGLAANALDAVAVRSIFAAKGRPADNPLIIHISSFAMLHSLYPEGWSMPSAYAAAVSAHWPGPLTILLPRSPLIPDAVTCGQPTMAVRMPSHPVALALIEAAGVPLAAPSANSSGRPSPTTAAHVLADLATRSPASLEQQQQMLTGMQGKGSGTGVGAMLAAGAGRPEAAVVEADGAVAIAGSSGLLPPSTQASPEAGGGAVAGNEAAARPVVAMVLDGGPCLCGVESTVLDALRNPPVVLRPGGVTYEQLQGLPGLAGLQVYRRDFVDAAMEAAPSTPGMKYRHYSPDAPVILVDPGEQYKGMPGEILAAAVRWQALLEVQSLLQGLERTQRVALLRTSGPSSTHPGLVAGPTAVQLLPVASDSTADKIGDLPSDLLDVPADLDPRVLVYHLGGQGDLGVVARELFNALRLSDELGVVAVVVEGVGEEDEGLAVMNRLRKAASRLVQV